MSSNKSWKDFTKIYKSRKTILEYLENRNYNISNYSNISFNELCEMAKTNQLDFIVEKDNNKSKKKIFVKYLLTNSINQIKNLINDLYYVEKILNIENEDEVIFVTRGKISKLLKLYKNKIFNEDKIFISYYNLKNTMYNILKHSYVPKHVKLNKKEITNLLEKYNIKNFKELPEISVYDPVAIIIGLRPGDICKIYRGNSTSIISKYYRYCIN